MAEHQTIVVFISSVFRDMHAERDLLNRFVFPQLQETLRARGHNCSVQWIDLRWGLDTSTTPEHEQELRIFQVCLGEIERSKPYFLCILGQAYGTEASPDAIENLTKEFEIELPDAAHSITGIEIQFALALAARHQLAPLFLFRDPAAETPDDPRMAAQKLDLSRRFPNEVHRYSSQELNDPVKAWQPRVTQLLIDWIEPMLPVPQPQAAEDFVAEYQAAFEILRHEVASVFVGREAMLDSLRNSLLGAAQGPHRVQALRAASGLGKTSLAVRLIDRLNDAGVTILHHFTGLRADGSSVDAMLRRFCDELCDLLGHDRPKAEVWKVAEPRNVFARLLESAAAERTIIVIVDTLEELENSPAGRLLTWWPRHLDGRAALYFTGREITAAANAWQLSRDDVHDLAGLMPDEARQLVVQLCQRRRRQLQQSVLASIMIKPSGREGLACENPLWLTLLVEELNLLEAQDFARTLQFTGGGGDRIERLLRETVENAPGNVLELIGYILARVERSLGRAAVARFTELLALSRSGLRPTDLTALWPQHPSDQSPAGLPISPLELSQLRHRLRGQVGVGGGFGAWRILHAPLRQAAQERYLPDNTVRQELHSRLADHFLTLPRFDPFRVNETAYHLAASGRHVDLARFAAHETGRAPAEVFLDLLRPAREDRLNLAGLVAEPSLNPADARDFVTFLITTVVPTAERSWSAASAAEIVEQSAAGLERREADDGDAETDEHETLLVVIENDAFEQLARLQHWNQAAAYVERSLLRIEQLVARRPGSVALTVSLAQTLERAGHAAYRTGQLDTAWERLERCVSLCRRIMEMDPQPRRRFLLASALAWLGIIHHERHDLATALAYLEEALSENRVATAVTADVDPIFADSGRDTLLLILEFLADVKAQRGDRQGALDAAVELIETREQLWEEDPGDLTRLRKLSVARLFHASILTKDDAAAAEVSFQKAADALAEVVSNLDDDPTAIANFCVSAAGLDTCRIRQLKLSVSLPHGPLLEKILWRAASFPAEMRANLQSVPEVYIGAASEVLDGNLLTALELCTERFVWWTSRLRGEQGTPSKEATRAALPSIGFYKVSAAQLRKEIEQAGAGGSSGSFSPKVLLSPLLPGSDADVGAAGKLKATPRSTPQDVQSALGQAELSMRAGSAVNAQRWREAAMAASGDIESSATVRQSSGNTPRTPQLDPHSSAANSPDFSPEKIAAEAARLENAKAALDASLKTASQADVLDAFYTWVTKAVDQLGALLRVPRVAVPQMLICQTIAETANRIGRPIEALQSLEVALDIGMQIPNRDADADNARLVGTLAIPQYLELSDQTDRPIRLARLRELFQFADGVSVEFPREVDAAVVAGKLAMILGQATFDEAKDVEGSLKLFERSIQLRTRAYELSRNPNIALDISAQFNRIGDIYFDCKDYDKADENYQQALSERKRLLTEAADDPQQTITTEYFIAGSLERLAHLKEARGDLALATGYFKESADLRERLFHAGMPDIANAAASLWWVRSRAADLLLQRSEIDDGLEWSAAADQVIADVVQFAPRTLSKMSVGLRHVVFEAEMAAAIQDFALWRAWMLRARGSFRALAAAGAPLKQFEVLAKEIEWSEMLSERPPAPLTDEFKRVLALLDTGNIAAARQILAKSRQSAFECQLLGKAAEIVAAKIAGRSDEAKTLLLRESFLLREESNDCDARLLLELRARWLGYLKELGAETPYDDGTPDIRTSANAIYGPQHSHVQELLALAKDEL